MTETTITAADAKRQAAEIVRGAISQLQTLVEAIEEVTPDARTVQKRKSRSLAVADRRVENKGTAYGRINE